MRHPRTLMAAAGLALALACAPAGLAAPTEGKAPAWPRGLAVVTYDSERALDAALARAGGAGLVRRLPALRAAVVRPQRPGAFALAASRLPGIRSVERLRARAELSEPALAPLAAVGPLQWQHAAVRADLVPAATLQRAASLTIAVIDSGADLTAPDLAAKAPAAHNVRTGSADVTDSAGHGTFVASLAAGSPSNGEGMAGAGGEARLLIVKATGRDGTITDADEAAAIVHAVDRGARILNLSFGGPATSVLEQRAVDYAVARGALLVAAVGNEREDGNPVTYPAALLQPPGSRGVGGRGLAVGGSGRDGAPAPFSNAGTYLSLAAPAVAVFGAVSLRSAGSAYPRTPLPGSLAGLYGLSSGTSYAAPQVAGAAALVWAANPTLTAAAVAQLLKETAQGRGTWTPRLGWGVLDVAAAVERAGGGPAPPADPVPAVARVRLAAQRAGRGVRLAARLEGPGAVLLGGRRLMLETAGTGSAWRVVSTGTTSAAGAASWRYPALRGAHRFRVRYAGAADLGAAVSPPVRTVVR